MKFSLLLRAAARLALLSLATSAIAAQPANPELMRRYEAMLLQSPDSGPAFDKLVQLATEADALDALDAGWKKAAEEGRGAAYVLLRARLAERLGRLEEAKALLAEAVKTDPSNRAGWQLLAAAEQAAGRAEKAIAAEEKVLALGAQGEERLAAFRTIAQMQRRLLRNDDAVKTLQRMVAEFPDDPFVLAEAGDALAEAGRTTEAREVFEKLREKGDAFQKLQTSLRLAELDARTKGRDAAVATYEQVLADSAETSWIHREARQRIEDLFRAQEDLPGLVAYYQNRLKAQPRDVEAVFRLGNALASLGRSDEAAAQFQKAIELAPDRADFVRDYAAQMLAAGDFDKAAAAYRRLVRDDPKNADDAEALGEALWKQAENSGDKAQRQAAIDAWMTIAPADSNDAARVARVAGLLAKHDLKNESLPVFDRALALDPDAFDLREAEARVLLKLGREKDAEVALAGAVAGNRDKPENYAELANAWRRLERPDQERRTVEAGLEKTPGNFDLLMHEARILAGEGSWQDVADLHERLMASLPGPQYIADLERQYLDALENSGQLAAKQETLLKKFDAGGLSAEADLRVLARMLLRANDGGNAQRVLAAAERAFPDSLEITRLEFDYEQRFGAPESQRRVLRRLADLDWADRAKWLAELARSWQAEGKWDEALHAAAERIALSPANADGYLFYAEICFAANRPEAGIAKLQEAVRLASDPVDARQRLARAYAETGNTELALRAQEEAFEQETKPEKRLRLIAPLAEYYLQAGRIDELIERLKRRREQEEGTRYSAYLAQIYLRLDDYASAREELARGLALQPRDAALLRQLLSLSERERNSEERLRYARMLADVEPSLENRLTLVDALVDQRENAAAVALLRELGPEIAKQGVDSGLLAQLLENPVLRGPTTELLQEQLARDGTDWKSMLMLALTLIGDQNYADADALLRRVREIPDAQLRAAPSSASSLPGNSFYAGPATKMSPAMKRLMAAGGGVGMILDALRRAQSMRWQGGRFGMGYQPLGNFPQGDLLPDAVRGAALGARAWIAVTQGSEEKFLADWRRDADRRKLSPEDRLIELSAMQAPEELTAEAQALAAAPDVTADQLLLAAQVLQNRPAPGRAVNADQERLVALYERLAAMSGGGFDPPSLAAVEFLRQAGHGEVAGALLDKMLAKLDRKDPRQTLAAISACMTLDRLEDARKLLGDLVVELQSTSAGTPGAYGQSMQIGWELGCRMLQRKELRAQGVELLAAILRESYGSTARLPGVPVFVSGLRGTRPMFGSPQWSLLSPENLENAVPLATKWINYWDRERLRGLHRALKSTGMLDAFLAELNRQEAAMHGEAGLYPRMAEVNLLWWDGRKKDAVARTRAIAKEFPDVDLGAFLASMLLAMKDYAGAQTALDAAPANDRDAAIRNIILGFSLATMERNREKAKALLGPFEKLCPQSDARYAVSNILDSLGLGEEARRMRNTGRGAGGRSEPPLAKRMRELSADKDRKQAVSIARAVLLGGTPSTLVEQRDNVRSSALDTLRRFSALEDFIVETDAQLRKQPDSLKLNGLMAELTRYGDSGRAIPYYRKLSELLPEDSRIRQTLAGLLRSGKRSGEAAEIYRKSFQTDFMGMMSGSYSDVFETFRDAGKIPELLDLFEQGSKAHRAELAEQYSGVFRWYGEQLAQAGDLASAERIYRMGIDAGVRDSELQRAYLDLLIRQGREKDAAQWVGEMLFPKPSPPPRLLAWSYSANRGMDNSPWRSWTSRGDGRERNMGDELLQTVKDPAALESFRERSREIRQRQPDDDTATMADLFLRVHCRDATVLEELRTMVAHPDRGPLQNVDFGSAIAYDLVDWPEGKPLALDLSLAARDRRTSPNLPFGACVQYTMPLVDLALECGRSDVARRELKSLVEKARAAGGNVANQVGSDTIFRIMDLSLDAGIASEAFGMLEAIKENAPPNNSIREEIARREADYRIAAGLPAPPQAIVWQAAENPDGAVTLAWRLGAARASNGRDGRVNVSQRDLPALDGKYDLELIVESPPNVRRRIATIKGANFTGRWTGRLPAAARRVVGELRARGDSAAIYGGVEIPIGGKGNLVRNPDLAASPDGRALEGWSASAASVRQIAKGGPDAWSPAMEIDASAHEVRLEGEFIPLEPDHDYQEMAWCVSLNGGGYSVGVEYFDENKKRIDSDSCSTWNERGCWGLASQGLTTRENSRSGFRRVTREARWMRPYLEFSGVVRMSGLRISELPPPDESEEDE